MPLYHIIVEIRQETESRFLGEINISKKRVEQVVKGFNSAKPFFFCGGSIKHSDIVTTLILKSENDMDNVLLPNGKRFKDTELSEAFSYFLEKKVKGVTVAASEFDIVPPDVEVAGEPTEEVGTGNEVFIVHGRDDKQALLLQKHLDKKLGIDAKMFEDFKEETGSNTIIELLEYIWKKAGYAFIITTPEDLGGLRDEFEKSKNDMFRGTREIEVAKACSLLENLKTRTRQNVVFEFGLFMGALGRDNVCCLLQEGTQERPSDIDGILYTSFNKSVDEKFGEIDSKLKNWQAKKIKI